jgi:hypothetical protein
VRAISVICRWTTASLTHWCSVARETYGCGTRFRSRSTAALSEQRFAKRAAFVLSQLIFVSPRWTRHFGLQQQMYSERRSRCYALVVYRSSNRHRSRIERYANKCSAGPLPVETTPCHAWCPGRPPANWPLDRLIHIIHSILGGFTLFNRVLRDCFSKSVCCRRLKPPG